jgi:hypothetical protein
VFGRLLTDTLTLAENSIVTGNVQVERQDDGCVRFCYVPPRSRTPRRHGCQPDGVAGQLTGEARADAEARVRPTFTSARYGTPAYAQLAATCAEEIVRGADDRSEMGAFHDLQGPSRAASLSVRLDAFTPAGSDTGLIFAS